MKLFKVLCVLALVFAVSTIAYAETQSVKVSGDITLRAFARNNYDLDNDDPGPLVAPAVADPNLVGPLGTAATRLNAGVESTDWATYLLNTAEVQIDADLTDNVSGEPICRHPPVIPGTNAAAIQAGVDILAHPGFIREEDARLAAEKGVYLEITSREGHSEGNEHVFETATKTGARLVLNTDTHSPEDLLTSEKRDQILGSLTDSEEVKSVILQNSEEIVKRIQK